MSEDLPHFESNIDPVTFYTGICRRHGSLFKPFSPQVLVGMCAGLRNELEPFWAWKCGAPERAWSVLSVNMRISGTAANPRRCRTLCVRAEPARCDGRYGSIGGSGSRYQTRQRIPFSLADMVLAGTTSAVWHTSIRRTRLTSALQCTYGTRAHFAMSYIQACMQKTDHFRQAQTPQTRKIRSEFAFFFFLSPLDTN